MCADAGFAQGEGEERDEGGDAACEWGLFTQIRPFDCKREVGVTMPTLKRFLNSSFIISVRVSRCVSRVVASSSLKISSFFLQYSSMFSSRALVARIQIVLEQSIVRRSRRS